MRGKKKNPRPSGQPGSTSDQPTCQSAAGVTSRPENIWAIY